MHQKFYIDTDEEISSVIDRLNKSMALDNYFVVPKRAIFLQSIVNLKLLKREADKTGKNIILVTQDEIGASMAHRAEINTCSSLDGLEAAPDPHIKATGEDNYLENKNEISKKITINNEMSEQDKQIRLKNIGSDDFYNHGQTAASKKGTVKSNKSQSKKISLKLTDEDSEPKRSNVDQESSEKIAQRGNYRIQQHEQGQSQKIKHSLPIVGQRAFRQELRGMNKLDPRKEKSLEKIFSSRKSDDPQPNIPKKVNNKVRKISLIFIAFCLLAFAGVAIYLLVPSAKIIVVPNVSENRIEADIHGANNVEADALNIPISVLDENVDITSTYDVVGSSASGKKAHGKVVIYNEYNSTSQTLVATTRLETSDKKIFRIVKSVIVPGTTVVDGSTKPGAIEVEVIADQAGSDFNIEPTDFKIPGFAGGPKYDKFYAKSTETFSGGSLEGENNGPAKITQQDIDNAKSKTETALKEKIDSLIAEKMETEESKIILPESKKITITKNIVNAKVGDMVDSLECTAVASVRILAFSEDDVQKIVQQKMTENNNQSQQSKEEITKIEYGNVESNFDNATLNLRVYAEVQITPDIDTEKIKQELLGKDVDNLGNILKKYSSIKNASVEFWPEFVSRIPQYGKKVMIEIKNENVK